MSRVSTFDSPVFERPEPAITVLAEALGISHDAARDALKALVQAGYVVAPRLPTNAMLAAYLEAYGTPCSTPRSAIIGIGKARVRWAAMAERGTRMALSWRRIEPISPSTENGKVVSISRAKGGHARAAKLSPERRREIARWAANARWGREGDGGGK